MPVLPLVASISLSLVLKSPRSIPVLIILYAARSFTLPPGLWPSNLKYNETLGFVLRTLDFTKGVLPIRESIELDIG